MKFIPKRVFQLVAFSTLFLLLVQTMLWGMNDSGLYAPISKRIEFVKDAMMQSLLAGLFTFFALFIPWLAVMLFFREFAQGMATMKDELAYLKGEPLPTAFEDNPRQQKIVMGMVGIVIGFALAFINVLVWTQSEDGLLALWCAVPVSLVMGVWWMIEGLRMKNS